MQTGRPCRIAPVGLIVGAVVLATGTAATARGETPSPTGLVRMLAAKSIENALPPGFTTDGYEAGYLRTRDPAAPQPPPGAVGIAEIGIAGCDCDEVRIRYTIYPSAATARAWILGDGVRPTYSIWRLKQLNATSLPHPRISGTVPGYQASVIVESSGHKRLYTHGVTEMNVLSGNVIVNVTTGSRTSTQHGNRVAARALLDAAVAHLRATRRG